jgi:predicted CXXCH cytochrome family protein
MAARKPSAVHLWLLAFGGLLGLCAAAFGQGQSCIECHSTREGELRAPAATFKHDIHNEFGLSCQDCHGGNPSANDVDLAHDRSFKGAPKRVEIPEFCGGCHANAAYVRNFNPSLRVDQLSEYWTSRHGQRLKQGDTKVAVCTDCHGVHGIQTAKYPKSPIFPWNVSATCGRCHANPEYMKPYGIPTSQLDDYKQSVHAQALFDHKDLGAPTCNDCHGNHGAFPPAVKSIASICRQCHPSTGDLFSKSPHKKAFDEMDISECEACHGNHKILPPSNLMLGTGKESVCLQCHESGSKGFIAAEAYRELLDGFETRLRQDAAVLAEAEKKGVEVGEPKFRLQDLNTILISAKNLTHDLNLVEIKAKLGEGDRILAEVQKAGAQALEEAKFRRQGLVVVTFFLALFALALYLKIRSMRAPGR